MTTHENKRFPFLQLKCCGFRSYRDWANSTWYKDNTNKEVPASCCKSDSDKPTCYLRSTFDVANIFTKVNLHVKCYIWEDTVVYGLYRVYVNCIL